MHSAPPATHPLACEDGLTLVEVMVAVVILVIGLLGLFSMLSTGTQITVKNLNRDAATSLAREGVERAREITYADLASAPTVASALSPVLEGSTAAAGATFQTVRRGVTFTTTIASCVLDDPSDGIGPAPGTPCKPLPPGPIGDGSSSSGPGSSTLSLNVLGIQITGGGTLVDAVCSLVGRHSVLDALIGIGGGMLSPLVNTGADVGVCSSNAAVAIDRQPADATSVTATVSWEGANSVTQRTLVSGPRVTS